VLFRFLNSQEERRNGQVGVKKFLAKAKRSGIKDVLLGKVEIPTSLDVIDEKTEEGKKQITDLDEIAFTELILSLDVSNSNGKIAFEDGNKVLAWEKLKKV
jgi:hypothetical protein